MGSRLVGDRNSNRGRLGRLVPLPLLGSGERRSRCQRDNRTTFFLLLLLERIRQSRLPHVLLERILGLEDTTANQTSPSVVVIESLLLLLLRRIGVVVVVGVDKWVYGGGGTRGWINGKKVMEGSVHMNVSTTVHQGSVCSLMTVSVFAHDMLGT